MDAVVGFKERAARACAEFDDHSIHLDQLGDTGKLILEKVVQKDLLFLLLATGSSIISLLLFNGITQELLSVFCRS